MQLPISSSNLGETCISLELKYEFPTAAVTVLVKLCKYRHAKNLIMRTCMIKETHLSLRENFIGLHSL